MDSQAGEVDKNTESSKNNDEIVFDSKKIARKADTEYFTKVDGAARRKQRAIAKFRRQVAAQRRIDQASRRTEKSRLRRETRLTKKQARKSDKSRRRKKIAICVLIILILLSGTAYIVVNQFGAKRPPEQDDGNVAETKTMTYEELIDEANEKSQEFNSAMWEGSYDDGNAQYQTAIDEAADDRIKALYYVNRAKMLYDAFGAEYQDQIFSDFEAAISLDPEQPYECILYDYADKLDSASQFSWANKVCTEKFESATPPRGDGYGSGEG